ncbi:hypothetical protein DEU34_1943 [Microbacterium sp. AG1240]|uniref:DUF6412 domain-containing protein n=1 Tax=Microbacterium sp. AG1240 TaxID=2183992 RepID=UPI000EB561A2|nr:DUF6412 domain-containing protein [Microbacterium sp. AG1240]RKT33352.1 hypothetical protein DEU34_1943 [Microbacterium sp. AG1240]
MFASIVAAFHLLATVLGLVATPDPAGIGVAVAIAAVGLLVLAAVAVGLPGSCDVTAPHPRRAIDISTPLAQSDPDAPGHPRPRAPQTAASAA